MKRLTERNSNGTVSRNSNNCPVYNCGVCSCVEECDKEIMTRLAVYEDKIESGQLVELPCKVGDSTWSVHYAQSYPIIHSEVETITITKTEIIIDVKNSVRRVVFSRDGKMKDNPWNVFFTEEEAEARIKELQEKL